MKSLFFFIGVKVLPKNRLFLVILLVLYELFYFLRMSADLLFVNGLGRFFSSHWFVLSFELLARTGWALLILQLVISSKNVGGRSGRKVLLFTCFWAIILAFLTIFSLFCIFFNIQFPLSLFAWFKALEVYFLLMWGLSILFLLLLPFIKKLKLFQQRSWLFPLTFAGAMVYFMLKSLSWLEMLLGVTHLPFEQVKVLWIGVLMIVFLGRLALIWVMTYALESGDKAEVK